LLAYGELDYPGEPRPAVLVIAKPKMAPMIDCSGYSAGLYSLASQAHTVSDPLWFSPTARRNAFAISAYILCRAVRRKKFLNRTNMDWLSKPDDPQCKGVYMTTAKPVLGAFNQGVIPTIACFIDKTTKTPLGVDLDRLVTAMQVYVDKHVAPVWGTPAKLVKSTGFLKDAWAIVFLDDADQPGALAYHDLTPNGLPLSKVFVRTTLEN
jgi:hypothetical protein